MLLDLADFNFASTTDSSIGNRGLNPQNKKWGKIKSGEIQKWEKWEIQKWEKSGKSENKKSGKMEKRKTKNDQNLWKIIFENFEL